MSDIKIDWAQFQQIAPAVVTTLRTLTKVIAESGLEQSPTELLKVRASQLNGGARVDRGADPDGPPPRSG
jgi:hypothetical protein